MCDCTKGWQDAFAMIQEKHNKEVKRLREAIRELQEDRERLLVDPEPVYAAIWFRDCDCAEASYARKFENEKEFQIWRDDFYESAEGPCSATRCTKEQYEAFEESTRDRALEAFEDGRGTAVLI